MYEESRKKVISVLSGVGKLTTHEILERIESGGDACRDNLVEVLIRMKGRGEVKGEIDVERGGWVWWVE